MRRAIGPILTTGVALAAAGVVVANPIVAPRADVQIPAVQLSAGTGDPASMLDQAFLDAIAPAPPESTNPFAVLRQLITSLAADATYLGKNAIVDAFVAGVTAVSAPELTASSTPYLPPLTSSPELAASVLPGLDLDALPALSDLGAALPTPSTPVSGEVVPVVQSLVSSVASDAGYVGTQLVAAAFAAGAVVAAEPGLISDTLEALIKGDLAGALQTAVRAVTAPLGPPVIILNALRAVVEKNIGGVAAALTAPEPDRTGVTVETSEVQSAAPTVAVADPAPVRYGRDAAPVLTQSGDPTAQPSALLSAADTRLQAAETAQTDPIPPADTATADETVRPVAPGSLIRDAIEAVGEQIGAAVNATGVTASATGAAAGDSNAKGGARTRGARPGVSASGR